MDGVVAESPAYAQGLLLGQLLLQLRGDRYRVDVHRGIERNRGEHGT